jgi:hypothetical protein
MKLWQNIVFAFVAKPWHLIVFALVAFLAFYFMGTQPNVPKR